jgi:uncharacterized protein
VSAASIEPERHSAIYEGQIRHRRFAERRHEFSYSTAMVYLDLDELPGLLGGRLLAPGPRLARFRRADYFGDPHMPLAVSVRERVAEATGQRPSGPIRLLTQLRSLGHCFNPVSLYYCHDAGGRLAAVLADVTNTPWGQRHGYVLAGDRGDRLQGSGGKRLHVSPFMGMDHEYEWQLTAPERTLAVHIASRREGELAFDATLQMTRTPLTSRTLTRMSARYPAGTLRTLALIYAQALRLRLKGVAVHPHPESARR